MEPKNVVDAAKPIRLLLVVSSDEVPRAIINAELELVSDPNTDKRFPNVIAEALGQIYFFSPRGLECELSEDLHPRGFFHFQAQSCEDKALPEEEPASYWSQKSLDSDDSGGH